MIDRRKKKNRSPSFRLSSSQTGPDIDILVQSRWKQVGRILLQITYISFHIWLPSAAASSLLVCLASVSSPHLHWQLGTGRHNPFINSNSNVMGGAEKWECRSGVGKQWYATIHFKCPVQGIWGSLRNAPTQAAVLSIWIIEWVHMCSMSGRMDQTNAHVKKQPLPF